MEVIYLGITKNFCTMKRSYLNVISSIVIVLFLLPETLMGSGRINSDGDINEGIKISTFDIDINPPLNYVMPYGAVNATGDLSLRAKGLILTGAGQPVVLVAFDWIGISNSDHEAFRLGGYEAESSKVTSEAESVLMSAMKILLNK